MNPRQARALLAAVRDQLPSGPMLVAFFAVMYYVGLRPEEAISLRMEDVILPDETQGEPEDQAWGEAADDHLPARLDQSSAGGSHSSRASLFPGPAALRPTSRVSVYMKRPGFDAPFVTCERPAGRHGCERSSRPRLRRVAVGRGGA